MNPRRQLGQLRSYERHLAQTLRWVFLFWLVPAVLLGAGLLQSWHGLVITLLVIAVLSGFIQHSNQLGRLRHFRARIAELEATGEDGA